MGQAPTGGGGAAPAPQIDPLCAQNNVSAARCDEWLKAKYANQSCADNGKMTRESCAQWLMTTNNGMFPGCEGKDESECDRIKELTLKGYLPAEARQKVEETLAAAAKTQVVVAVPDLTAVAPSSAPQSAWYPSRQEAGTETSSQVVVKDSDHDGLPDDVEVRLGTDPNKSDTDGDGVSDADEVRRGTDPTSAEARKPGRKLAPVDAALASGKPLEQPRSAGQTDPTFAVSVGRGQAQAGNRLSGRSTPNSVVSIFVYSYVPLVMTVETDNNGNLTYDLGSDVADGSHTVYVALSDEEGRVTKKSEPVSFFIKEAKAVSEFDFLQPDLPSAAEPAKAAQNAYLYASLGMILLAAVATYFLVIRKRVQS
jgi:hypothetical protein